LSLFLSVSNLGSTPLTASEAANILMQACSGYVPFGVDPKLETLKIETHCSERRFEWQVPEFSGWNFGLQ
jgi:hypothetical protein